jgi:hypothetical protein
VAGEIEHDGLALAFLLRGERLVDGAAYRVRRFRGGQDPFGPREQDRGSKVSWGTARGPISALVVELADERAIPW